MGSTNKTTHYELSQFVGTDKPAWLQDYNGDMEKIDAGIYGAKTAADDAALAASAAQGDATTALGDIASLTTEVGTISGTLDTAVGNINTINSLIGNGTPTTTDQTIIGAINEIHAEISSGFEMVGTHIKIAEITADGVKTFSQLLGEVYTAIVNYLNSLEDNESITLDTFNETAIGSFINQDVALLTKQSGFGSTMFDRIGAYNGAMRLQVVDLKASNAVFQSAEIVFSNDSLTGDDNSNTVPASGVKFSVRITKYRELA